MASINKLSIRGIRAFSPEDEEQFVEFHFPLTIIVGQNGCGKTTIIEALRYAVTGSLPPTMGKSGAGFVHDPKSCGLSTVKANVKLRFQNRADQTMVVVRSMEVVQKPKTTTFRALDGVLRTMDPRTGQRKSASHKCTEMDQLIPTLVGVSKPILEHVVFCHQEESSWPLQEGAALKKRFDDIFDSTKYAKALEELKNQQKKYKAEAHEHQVDLASLTAFKKQASQIREELEEVQERKSEEEAAKERSELAIQENDKKIASFKKFQEQVASIQSEQESCQNDITKTEETIKTLKCVLKDKDASSRGREELEQEIDQIKNDTGDELVNQLEREIESIKLEVGHLMDQQSSIKSKIAKIEHAKEEYEVNKKKRLDLCRQLSSAHRIRMPSYTEDEAEFDSYFQSLKIIGDKIKTELSDLKDHNEREMEQSQRDMNQIQLEKDSLEGKGKDLARRIEALRNEINTISQTQTYGTQMVRRADLNHKAEEITDAEKRLEAVVKSFNMEHCKKSKKEIEDKQRATQSLLEEEKETERELAKIESFRREVELQEKQVKEMEDQLQDSFDETHYILEKYKADVTSDLRSLDAVLEAMRESLDRVISRHQSLEAAQLRKQEATTQCVTKLNITQERIEKLKTQINSLEAPGGRVSKIRDVISILERTEGSRFKQEHKTNPHKLLAYIRGKEDAKDIDLNQLSTIIDCLLSIGLAYEMDTITPCPCCGQDMDATVKDRCMTLMEDLADEKKSLILKKTAENKSGEMDYAKYAQIVLEGADDWTNIQRYKSDLDGLQASIVELEHQVVSARKGLEIANSDLMAEKSGKDQIQRDFDIAKKLRDEATRTEQEKQKVASKRNNCNNRLLYSAPMAKGRDLDQVRSDIEKKMAEKDALSKDLDTLNEKMFKSASDEKSARMVLENLQAEYKDLKNQFEEREKANARQKELREEADELDKEKIKVECKLTPVNQKLSEKQHAKERLKQKHKREEDEIASKVETAVKDVERYSNIQSAIEGFLGSGKMEEAAQQRKQLGDIDRSITRCKDKQDRKQAQFEEAKKQNEDRKSAVHNLENSLQIIFHSEKLLNLKQKYRELKVDESSIEGFDEAQEDYHNALHEIEILRKKVHKRDGLLVGLEEQITALKQKLKSKDLKEIDDKHRVMAIKYETTNIVVSDLGTYHSAVDKALMEFHKLKIEDINRIISELWSLTYKGEDITNIKIVSGDEGSAKKSYNYRVVMTKNGSTDMDMRGRCSAGQRVLASIIIRLALAETFCLSCGVMALDEPTTNLDYNNKIGLATALAQIIANRKAQQNFQLIIITHDEEFVQQLKNELSSHTDLSMPENVYKVVREEAEDSKMYSKIYPVAWEDL